MNLNNFFFSWNTGDIAAEKHLGVIFLLLFIYFGFCFCFLDKVTL